MNALILFTLFALLAGCGPFVKGRIIDLSKKAAERLDMLRVGVVPVRVQQLAD